MDENGDVEERYHYSPYGEVTMMTGAWVGINSSTIGNEYLYTGRRLDPETGLQLNRNRFYASHLGRWVNRDPIGYLGSQWNLYEYVGGMPTIGMDPSGEACVKCTCKRPALAGGGVFTFEVPNCQGLAKNCCTKLGQNGNRICGKLVDFDKCGTETEKCTPYDNCSKSSCALKCTAAATVCKVGCAFLPPPAIGPCLFACNAARTFCLTQCNKCKKD